MRNADRSRVEKGRGAVTNPAGRFEGSRLEAADDGWGSLEELPRHPATVLSADRPKRAITRNDSPDVPFEQSVNPYQGCEHGCIYCFARPSHSYWNLGPGLDFETRIFHKPGLAQLLERELRAPGYVCKPINLGANTDPYQPAEREHRTTRQLLEVLLAHRHPVTIVTKGALVLRDADLLGELARLRLVTVFVSLTTLDDVLKRTLEPRAASPAARLRAIRQLTEAGVRGGAGRVHAAAAAARARNPLRAVAARALPGACGPRPQPAARGTRGAAERSAIRSPDARRRAVRRARRGTIPGRLPAPRGQRSARGSSRNAALHCRSRGASAGRIVQLSVTIRVTIRARNLDVYSVERRVASRPDIRPRIAPMPPISQGPSQPGERIARPPPCPRSHKDRPSPASGSRVLAARWLWLHCCLRLRAA